MISAAKKVISGFTYAANGPFLHLCHHFRGFYVCKYLVCLAQNPLVTLDAEKVYISDQGSCVQSMRKH